MYHIHPGNRNEATTICGALMFVGKLEIVWKDAWFSYHVCLVTRRMRFDLILLGANQLLSTRVRPRPCVCLCESVTGQVSLTRARRYVYDTLRLSVARPDFTTIQVCSAYACRVRSSDRLNCSRFVLDSDVLWPGFKSGYLSQPFSLHFNNVTGYCHAQHFLRSKFSKLQFTSGTTVHSF